MGAACGTVNCVGKKHSKYPNPTIIKRPQKMDLSFEEEMEGGNEKISIPPDHDVARIGVYFQYDELIKNLPES